MCAKGRHSSLKTEFDLLIAASKIDVGIGMQQMPREQSKCFFPRLFSLVVVEESRGDEERPVRPTCLADSHYHHCDDRSGSCAQLFKVSAVKNISNPFVQYSHLDPATLFYVTLSPSSKRRFLLKRGSTRSTLSPTRPHRTCFFIDADAIVLFPM